MRLYVGNLSFKTTEDQLESLFTEFGPVQSASLVMDRDTGRPRGFGFIEMSDDHAKAAMAALNGKTIDGRGITVNEARPRGEGGGGGGGGGSRGGARSRGGW